MNSNYFKTIFLVSRLPGEWPDSFAIVTAHNPMDAILSTEENRRRSEKLLKEIKSENPLPIIGSSEDLSHQEMSYYFKTKPARGISLGRKFDQRAIFFVDRGELQLVDCSDQEVFLLGKFIARVREIKPGRGQSFAATSQ